MVIWEPLPNAPGELPSARLRCPCGASVRYLQRIDDDRAFALLSSPRLHAPACGEFEEERRHGDS